MRTSGLILLTFVLLAFAPAVADDGVFIAARAALIDELRSQGRRDPPPGSDGFDERVLQAMLEVERHEFVPAASRSEAYRNYPLPIGHGQTISQPYIVALMTDLVAPKPDDVVLEVGTGSGYQAAVLAKLVARVYSLSLIHI